MIYDIEKSYLENAVEGPFFSEALPARKLPPEELWTDFLGERIAFPLGVPAGPLLNADWIRLAGSLGFDLPCYKTIRSREHPGHPLPNMVYVDAKGPWDPKNLPKTVRVRSGAPQSFEDLAVTNSFGMPSRSPEYLAEDIPRANAALGPGQAMIVSVVGSSPEDFVAVSLQAKEYGAKLLEANFSCPNVATGEGEIFNDPSLVYEIASKIVKAVGGLPLIIKVGYFPDPSLLRKTMVAAAGAGARAVCGINTISAKVVDREGRPALGKGREVSGICGCPIREAALTFTEEGRRIIDEEKLGLMLMTTGGALKEEHLRQFLNAGADIAMSATGMMWDPLMAMRYCEKYHP